MNNLYNLNIERAVLASILFSPEIFMLNRDKIIPELFYLPAHKNICEIMHELENEDKPLDEEFIKMKLVKEEKFDEEAILEILSTNPLPRINKYIEELQTKNGLRGLRDLSLQIRKDITQVAEVHEIIGNISKTCDEIGDKGVSYKIKNIAQIANEFYDEFEEALNDKGYIGVKSGIYVLDNIIGAFTSGDLVVVASRPSMGKTSFATTLTDYADKNQNGVLFDSLEMSRTKIFRRLHAYRSGERLKDIKRGVMQNPERFKRAFEGLRKSKNIIIHDESYLTIHQLIAKASIVFRKNPHIKYWFIDHIRYIKKDGVNISQEVSEITKLIKKTAKEYGVVAFLLSQLNRANEQRQNKRPMLSDLRESGAVEEDADIVLGLHRESYYNRNDPSMPEEEINPAEILILKNRDGQSGCAKCWFDGPHAGFINNPPIMVHDYNEGPIEFGGVI